MNFFISIDSLLCSIILFQQFRNFFFAPSILTVQ